MPPAVVATGWKIMISAHEGIKLCGLSEVDDRDESGEGLAGGVADS